MHRRTILVVEDDPLLRLDAIMLFEEGGLDVVACSSGDSALEHLRTESDSVFGVFTDVQMPGLVSGLDLAETVAERWPHITVLVTSGRVRVPAPLPRRVSFVPKPWLPLHVLTTMQQALEAA